MKKKIITTIVAIIIIISTISISLFYFLIGQKDKNQEKNIPPIAKIYVNKTQGKIPLEITFESHSIDYNDRIVQQYWDLGDGTTSYRKNITHYYEEQGKYKITLTVTDDKNDKSQDVIEIIAIDNYPPIAYASADTIEGRTPLKVNFNGWGEDIDGDIVSYTWDFGDKSIIMNTTSNNQNTSYLYLKSGTYVVNFTVTDDNGAKDTKMIKIEVKPNLLTLGYRFFLYMRWILNSIKNLLSNFGDN